MRQILATWVVIVGCASSAPSTRAPVLGPVGAPAPAIVASTTTTTTSSPRVGRVGDVAPLFYLRPSNPEPSGLTLVDLNRWVGRKATEPRPVLLSFAAEFCGPCKKELAAYAEARAALADTGAQVVVVLVDEDPAQREKMQAYLRDELKLPFPVVADALQLIAKGYGVDTLPHNVIVGVDGRIAWVKSSYVEGLSIPTLIEALRTTHRP